MKKFLLSIAAVFAVMSLNAKTVISLGNADFVDANSKVAIAADGTVVSWGWHQAALPNGPIDATALDGADYIVYTFNTTTVDCKTFVACGENWDVQPEFDFNAGTTLFGISLAADKVADNLTTLQALVIQPKGTGKVDIKEIAFMSEEEFKAAQEEDAKKAKIMEVYSDSTFAIPEQVANYSPAGWIGLGWKDMTISSDYKTLVVEIASSDAPFAFKAQGATASGDWDQSMTETSFSVGKVTSPITLAIPTSAFNGKLAQCALCNANAVSAAYTTDESGAIVKNDDGTNSITYTHGAENVVVTKVYLTSEEVTSSSYPECPALPEVVDPAGINNINAVATNNGAIYNLAGMKVNASYKGAVIAGGKKFVQK